MKLKAWRAQRVLTQKGLADAAGLSMQTVSAIEQGKQHPTVQTARKIAAALGIGDPLEIDEVREAMERILREIDELKDPAEYSSAESYAASR